jgi:hypothetical protein
MDSRSINSIPLPQSNSRNARRIVGADGSDLLTRKRGHAMPLAARKALRLGAGIVSVTTHKNFGMGTRDVALTARRAAFHIPVDHVGLMCSKPEVSGIYARGVIPAGAVVADHYTFGDFTVGNFPNETVSGDKSTRAVGKQAIAVAPFRGSPKPAAIGLVDLSPETIQERLSSHVASLRYLPQQVKGVLNT